MGKPRRKPFRVGIEPELLRKSDSVGQEFFGVATPSTTAPIAKGNRMPPHRGKAVYWKLIKYA